MCWTLMVVLVPLVFVRESLFPFYHAKLFALQGCVLVIWVIWGSRVRPPFDRASPAGRELTDTWRNMRT